MDLALSDFMDGLVKDFMVQIEEAKRKRAELMPTEKEALLLAFEAWKRLKELGWKEAIYCPKDGTVFSAIEAGDMWPSHPILFKLKEG